MSLVSTLAKAAVAVAVAKGMGKLVSGARAQQTSGLPPQGHTPGRGTPYDAPTSRGSAGDGGLLDALGGMLGTGGPRGRGSVGSVLEDLSRRSRSLEKPKGASAAPQGGIARPERGSLGDMLDQSLNQFGEPEASPSQAQEELAGVLLRALLQAAKADGRIDAKEKESLMKSLGELDQAEVEFVNRELAAPIDVGALARNVPGGAEQQVYLMSLMGIDLDTKQEAKYLHDLASALNLDAATVNAIHDQVGEPRIFR